MRKFLICSLIIAPFFLKAQNISRSSQLFVGYIAGGMNVSQIAGDRMAGYRKVGGNVGVGAHIMYKPFFSNSIEIAYSMRGSQSSFKNNDPLQFKKYSFDYVEIPVLFNYHESNVAIFQAGVTFARLVRFDAFHTANLVNGDPKDWDFSVTLGGVFLIQERFGINLKGNFSMNSVIRGKDVNSRARRGGWYHNALTIRFMYLFKKKDDLAEK